MSAAVVSALGDVRCEEVATPEPAPGKVLVKTRLGSICGSDLHIAYMGWNVRGYPLSPGHPGHEAVGEVVDGGGTGFEPTDIVLTTPNVFQAACFAGYQLLDPRYLLKLPDSAPLPQLLMAQQLGTVIYGSKRLPSLDDATVVVIGQGSVGLFHDFWLRRLGAGRIIAIEPVPERIAAARAFGVDEAIDVVGDAATHAVLDLTNGHGSDVVVEAVGSVDTMAQALIIARPSGRIALFGLPPTMDAVPFDWDTFFRKRLTMHAVHGAQEEPGLPDFQAAVDLIVDGEIDVRPFLTHRFPIDRVQDAFNLADSKEDGALKVSLTF